jgi:hypothetical protein
MAAYLICATCDKPAARRSNTRRKGIWPELARRKVVEGAGHVPQAKSNLPPRLHRMSETSEPLGPLLEFE